ncbi:hypothetical protein ACLKOZ_17000 [Arthrobacter sp. R4]|uniref:hypothetical protein n=1 Tax=Arthrobacter sp. R4 TaxID=644417 RepID=UPI003ED98455
MTTNEQRQAIAKYEDLAEHGTLRPADRQDLKHLLTVIREQAEMIDNARELTTAAVNIHGRLSLRDLLMAHLEPK